MFSELYDAWVDSGYDKWVKPSCDRTDPNISYVLDNLKLMTWRENLLKVGFEMGRAVEVYDIDMQLIDSFSSIRDCVSEYDSISTHHVLKHLALTGELFDGCYFVVNERVKNES